MRVKYVGIIALLLVAVITLPLLVVNIGTSTQIGVDDRGYVTKEVYAHYGPSTNQIVIITGIHPRESISIAPEQWAAKVFAILTPVEIINYNIVVQKDPQDYNLGRANGEGLAADYILPDIKKSDYDVVIIAHAHQPGYGEGYYVATPEMDDTSVLIARLVTSTEPSFIYYPGTKNSKAKTSSAKLVSKPLAAAGYPTLVYEIPENVTSLESFLKTYSLLENIYYAFS
jgi:hypothetical protein